MSALSKEEYAAAETFAPQARRTVKYAALKPLCALADAAIVILASFASGLAYHLIALGVVGNLESYTRVGLTTGLIFVAIVYHAKLYRLQEIIREDDRDYQQILAIWALAILILSVIIFVLKMGGWTSRGTVIVFAITGAIGLTLWRKALKQALRRAVSAGLFQGRRGITIGQPAELARFGRQDLLFRFGIDEIERISLPPGTAVGGAIAEWKNALDNAMDRAREVSAEELILALPWGAGQDLNFTRNELRASPLPVRLLPDGTVSELLTDHTAGAIRSLFIEVQRAPLTKAEQLTKRVLDIIVAGLVVLLLAPLMALVAMAIRLETPGPIIFKQRRKGFNGRQFVIYKFRTMTVTEDGAAIVQATKGDRRITRIGRLLRRTSIDELPQLLNVLKGEMSIVGPRPHAVAHDDEYGETIAKYAYRHHVKPGMTGWAQVNGLRGETPSVHHMAKRIELDLWYIDNWSIVLDLKILLLTFFEVIRQRNAY